MPLIANSLQSDLKSLFDSPKKTEAEAISGWVSAIQSYTLSIIPPSTTVALAAQSLRAGLAGFGSDGATLSKLPTAMLQFATLVGTGMVPTGPPFTPAVPPVTPLVVPFVNTDRSQVAAQTIAQAIDLWMKTGIGPATGLAPWS